LNLSKSQFQQVFGGVGYTETFEALNYKPLLTKLPALIQEHARPEGQALDIGCGSGNWTHDWILPCFRRVTAVDVIGRPPGMDAAITYFDAGDRDYSLGPVASGSMDFVHSLGCFCHLSNSANVAYLHSIHRVLKPDGVALVVFANWPNHPCLDAATGEGHYRESPNLDSWFYNDEATVAGMAQETGFELVNAFPGFRDLVALLTPQER